MLPNDLSACNFLDMLSVQQREAIESAATKRIFHKKTVLFNSKVKNEIHFIQKGIVKMVQKQKRNNSYTIDFLTKNDFFEELPHFHNIQTYVEAASDIEILTLSYQDFWNILQNSPQALKKYIYTIKGKLLNNYKYLFQQVFYNNHQKLASIILRLSQYFGYTDYEGVVIEFFIPHREIAQLIGTSREATTKAMNKLKKRGIIDYKHNFIVIKDSQKLRDILSGSTVL